MTTRRPPRDRSSIVIVRVETPVTGTENVSRGCADRSTFRAPLWGLAFSTDGGVGVGVGPAPGVGVGVPSGVGDGAGTPAPPAARSRAGPTCRRPYPESAFR